MEPPWGDEHGFLNPELAAAHARAVQGGYSTPEIEARRMIEDGGVGAERAHAWLASRGQAALGEEFRPVDAEAARYDPLEDLATYLAAALPGSGTPAKDAARAAMRLVQALGLTTSSRRDEILAALRRTLQRRRSMADPPPLLEQLALHGAVTGRLPGRGSADGGR